MEPCRWQIPLVIAYNCTLHSLTNRSRLCRIPPFTVLRPSPISDRHYTASGCSIFSLSASGFVTGKTSRDFFQDKVTTKPPLSSSGVSRTASRLIIIIIIITVSLQRKLLTSFQLTLKGSKIFTDCIFQHKLFAEREFLGESCLLVLCDGHQMRKAFSYSDI